MIGRRRLVLLAVCIIALCSLLVVPLLLQPKLDVPSAIEKAIDFFEGLNEPDALLFLDVMHRRFGITSFADALQRYDQILAEKPDQASIMRVFRRIADHDNVFQNGDLNSVTYETDLLTVPALYCDRLGLPTYYREDFIRAANLGGYMLTHALLAYIWIQENGCELSISEEFIEYLYHANAALINKDSVVDDLELEAAAFLHLAGQGSLVDDIFIERVLAVQRDDGGWLFSSDEPGESHWHATVLGLLLLLHIEYPANSYPHMLASDS